MHTKFIAPFLALALAPLAWPVAARAQITIIPGSSVGGEAGSAANRATDTADVPASGAAANGNQRRNAFRCIVESVKQKFTLFSPEGVPLRATLTVTLREYRQLPRTLRRRFDP